jgi:peptidoglycan/xylan/chitin deacetylase (PgdA/CDA1 family)
MYHHVAREQFLPSDPHLYVTPEILLEQIRWFKKQGFEFVTLSEAWNIIKNKETKRKAVALTFDDLFFDFYSDAMPVITSQGIKATGFAISSNVTETSTPRPCPGGMYGITVKQLREINDAGVEIGSHTVSHRELTTLSDKELEVELVMSKAELENYLGKEVPTLCYPRGRFGVRVMEYTEKAGYNCACATTRGNLHVEDDKYKLKRIRAGLERVGMKLWYSTKPIYDFLNHKRTRRETERLEKTDISH